MEDTAADQVRPRARIRLVDVGMALLGLIPTALALNRADAWVDGFTLSPWWTALVVAAVGAVGDAVTRPIVRALLSHIGGLGAVILGTAANVALIYAAIWVVPGAHISGWRAVLLVMLVVAVVRIVVEWVFGANDSAYVVTDLIRRGKRVKAFEEVNPPTTVRSPGVVVIQIDGMPHELLTFGISSGVMPTMSRWIRSGSHEQTRWWARLPSTTPASQAGLLHGNNDGIVAFRWYEKDPGRLVVTNHPDGAALVESRISNGRGLLADGGASISNIFSGDAPTSQMVFSKITTSGVGPGRGYLQMLANPFTLPRSILMTLGEMVKEIYQAYQQKARGIEPRMKRGGFYIALRGLTNVMLRNLNVAIVSDHMMQGTPVVYVDFVDYDEIAHHAGVARKESMDSLTGVDQVIGTLEKVAAAAPRDYHFVVVSDHGQSQGATYRQLHDRTLEQVVRDLIGADPDAVSGHSQPAEEWGPINAMVTELLGATSVTARWAKKRAESEADQGQGDVVLSGAKEAPTTDQTEIVVVGSGNVGLVWFAKIPGRLDLAALSERFPNLIAGLVSSDGVGFVVVDSERGPVAIGAHGTHVLRDGTIEGEDPLAPFAPRARADLLRVTTMDTAPDIYVHSSIDPATEDVHAFEELVGCHGGLGGWQNNACLVYPSEWSIDEDLIDRSVPGDEVLSGADVVHQQLVRWLERSGLRSDASSS